MRDESAEPSDLHPNEPLAFKDWRWMLPSDSMVIRRYKSFCYFKKVIEDQEFRFGPATVTKTTTHWKAKQLSRYVKTSNKGVSAWLSH